jgi:cell division protein FtsW
VRPIPARFPLLLAVVVVLNLFGLVMVLSASSVEALHALGSSWFYFNRQVLWTAVGLVALLVGIKVDYHVWRRLVGPALLVSVGLLVLVLVPGFGTRVNGSLSWFRLGPLSFQPAEVVKVAVLLYTADLLARRADRMHEPGATLFPPLLVLGVVGALLMVQPDLGSSIVVVAIVMAVLFIGGVPLVPLGGVGALMGAAGGFLALSAPYRRARLLAFLHPDDTRLNEGYQLTQALVGLASGGVGGVGLGQSRAKWGFLPEAHTDFIFAVIGEELGLVGCLGVLALFAAFGALGIRVALKARDRFGTLLAGGITAWILVQAIVNIGGVVGVLPITGLTLPFVSFGGTSLLVTMGATGILLNVARQGS